jgi:hypothetical protein
MESIGMNEIIDHGEGFEIPPPTGDDIWELLEKAIATRVQVIATYNGRRRAFCPHALGYKGEKRHVLVYQFADERDLLRSSVRTNQSDGWRCLDVDRLEGVALREGPWYSAPNIYNPQSCMDDIRAVIQVFPTATRQPSPGDDDAETLSTL